MKNSEIYNFNQGLEKLIYKFIQFLISHLQSTHFWPNYIIYNLQVSTLSDLQSTMEIMVKSTITNLTSPITLTHFEIVFRIGLCLIYAFIP